MKDTTELLYQMRGKATSFHLAKTLHLEGGQTAGAPQNLANPHIVGVRKKLWEGKEDGKIFLFPHIQKFFFFKKWRKDSVLPDCRRDLQILAC